MTLPETFLRPPWPSTRDVRCGPLRGAQKDIVEGQACWKMFEKVTKILRFAWICLSEGPSLEFSSKEDMQDWIYEKYMEIHLEDSNETILTFANQAEIVLAGVNHESGTAAKAAGNKVRELQPSALVLELCRERVGMIIQGNDYREERQRNWMKPDELDASRRATARYADENRQAFAAFKQRAAPGKMLVLADLKSSFVDSQLRSDDDVVKEEIMAPRDRNLAIQIFTTLLLGHRSTVAILGANHLPGVEKELRALNASFSELEGEFSEVASSFGQTMWREREWPLPTGYFIRFSGCKKLHERQKKLKAKVPVSAWRGRENRSAVERRKIVSMARRIWNPESICSMLSHDGHAIEPESWDSLLQWTRMTVEKRKQDDHAPKQLKLPTQQQQVDDRARKQRKQRGKGFGKGMT